MMKRRNTAEKTNGKGQRRRAEEERGARQAGYDEVPELRPEWVVGACPECGGALVENPYWPSAGGLPLPLAPGRWTAWRECWNALGARERRTCGYRVAVPVTAAMLCR